MSSSNTSANIVAGINRTKENTILFGQIWSFILFSCGTIGHIFNLYVFTHRSLRSNPCSRYFLASTFSGLVVVYINIPVRLLQFVYNINILLYSYSSCIIFSWILVWARAQTSWFIFLACIDRFLCSSLSATLRSWSSVKVACGAIPMMTLIVGLFYIHVLFFSQYHGQQQTCALTLGNYSTLFGIWNLIVFSFGPSTFMFIFGLLTVRHIHQKVKPVVPINIRIQSQSQQQQQKKKIDGQLIKMMLVQSIVLSILSSPAPIGYLYTSTNSNNADAIQTARNNSVANIVGFLSLTGPCISFYLFTLSSRLFRRQIMHLFTSQCRKVQKHMRITKTLARRTN